MAIQKMEQKLGIDIAHGISELQATLNDKLIYLMSSEKKAKVFGYWKSCSY
jgi:hypothetical protein